MRLLSGNDFCSVEIADAADTSVAVAATTEAATASVEAFCVSSQKMTSVLKKGQMLQILQLRLQLLLKPQLL